MILYHGSNQLITKIDLSKSKDFKDFGRGFYLTKDYTRAVAMAQRTTAIIGEGSPEVSPFIFNPSRCPIDVRIKKFDGRTAEWALFVLRNREKSTLHAYKHDYDIVIGPVADSRVDAILGVSKELWQRIRQKFKPHQVGKTAEISRPGIHPILLLYRKRN